MRTLTERRDWTNVLFTHKTIEEINTLVSQRWHELGMALGRQTPANEALTLDERSPLALDVALLMKVANGELQRTDVQVRRVELALQRVMDVLVGNALQQKMTLPDDFWRTEIGVLISRARWWVSIDDLITITNAAALAFGESSQASRMRIARAIDSGLLDWVPDPSVANPQQNRRVLRSQVERLREQRSLPETE